MTTLAFLTRRTTVDAVTGCWLWTGAVTSAGYATLRYRGRLTLGHRLALQLTGGIDRDALACHTCRARRCVNPAHLYRGTHRTNAQDREAARRAA